MYRLQLNYAARQQPHSAADSYSVRRCEHVTDETEQVAQRQVTKHSVH